MLNNGNIHPQLVSWLFLILLSAGCSENFSDNPIGNQAPRTFVSIFTESVLNTTTSRKVISWWGDDPDGTVEGFIYTFNENAPSVTSWSNQSPDPNWTFTEETQNTFSLTLSGTDTVYTFWVKAVDNVGDTDPVGAIQQFPINNSRPSAEFLQATDVPETTFTVANFAWKSSDLDGDDTIEKFQYVLDDTTDPSAWVDLAPSLRSITLTASDGLTEGEHIFFFRAIDVAGASSDIIRMPRDEAATWFVREPQSSFLLLDDYNFSDGSDEFYKTSFEAMVGPVDVWDIKSNGRALEPPSTLAFTLTLLLYDRIFWYTDPDPNLDKADGSIPDFLANGGKVIMSVRFKEFATNDDTPLIFSPVDSLLGSINRIRRNQILRPTGSFAELGFPDLQVNRPIIANVIPIAPKNSSETVYVLPEDPDFWPGTPSMAAINGASTFVFFAFPLAQLDGLGTVNQVLDKILNEIF